MLSKENKEWLEEAIELLEDYDDAEEDDDDLRAECCNYISDRMVSGLLEGLVKEREQLIKAISFAQTAMEQCIPLSENEDQDWENLRQALRELNGTK